MKRFLRSLEFCTWTLGFAAGGGLYMAFDGHPVTGAAAFVLNTGFMLAVYVVGKRRAERTIRTDQYLSHFADWKRRGQA